MENLEQAVIEQLGYDANTEPMDEDLHNTLSDVRNHGASGGVGGFIYYNETIDFFDKNKESIMALTKEMADDVGYTSTYEMIANFNCLNDNYSLDEIVESLHGVDNDASTQVKNAMSWFALEEVARSIDQ
tara:strand:- start:54 stop:443 length:390 start_codon:yes stop_codon:yes gene_type:complete